MRTAVVIAFVQVLMATMADAQPKVVLMESHSDARPAGMSQYVAEIVAQLNIPGLVTGDDLRTQLEVKFSRPAFKATGDDLQALVALVSQGQNAYAAANFSVAVAKLTQAADALGREPGALVHAVKLRDARKEALMTLAKALAKLQRENEAKAVIAEAVRSYPDLKFDATVYPPNIVQLGTAVLKERSAHPKTTLVIETSPPGKEVMLDEQKIGNTPRTLTNLDPGTYRVYFPSMGGRGAYRTVDVLGDKTTTVYVSSEIEDHIEPEEYLGLRFATAAQQRESEVPIACAIAKAVGANELIILTRQRSPAAEAELLGAIYDVSTGHRKWGVILPLAPHSPDDTALARFARSLRTRREVEGIQVAPEHTTTVATPAPVTKAPEPAHVDLTTPLPERRDTDSRPGFRVSRPLKIMLSTSLTLAAAFTAAYVATDQSYGCSNIASLPCAPGSTARTLDAVFLGAMTAGWSVGLGSLISLAIDYSLSRHARDLQFAATAP